jgi:hypothetical protein
VAADIIRAMVVGIVLLAQLDVSTSTLQSSLFMLMLGIGIGCVMQVIMLLAQNSVEQRDMGVASSTSTFTRSIGGTFGVAIFGAIFSAQLHSGLENVGASGVASGTGQIDPATLDALPPSVLSGVLDAIAGATSFRLRLGDDLRRRRVPPRRGHQGRAALRRRRRPGRRCTGTGVGTRTRALIPSVTPPARVRPSRP